MVALAYAAAAVAEVTADVGAGKNGQFCERSTTTDISVSQSVENTLNKSKFTLYVE